VCIYSPRFGAVRQVVGLKQNRQQKHLVGVHLPTKLVQHEERQSAESHLQRTQARRGIRSEQLTEYRSRKGDGQTSSAVHAEGYYNEGFKAHAQLAALGSGVFDEAEMPWLAHGNQAAVAWSHDLGVQVILDLQAATAEVATESAAVTYTFKEPPGAPKLRIIKVASTQFAEPGETVNFTLRFDNVGNQLIGNVTIIDNLTTRLEYVPDSAQSSVPSQFGTQVNEGESLVLRWEITDPIEPGDGGVISFTCRVR
jgi:uncharacterized repeat protein (TIGR01451 family)